MGANGVETLPIGRYDSTQNYAATGVWCHISPRALDNIANLHIGRAGDFTTLQLMQYFSASSYSAPSFKRRALHPARLVLAPDNPDSPGSPAGGGADGALNAVFEAGVIHFGLLRVGQSVERHVKH